MEFEQKLCETTIKYKVDKSDLDIINYSNFNILFKINSKVSIFIGQDEDDNELLLEKVYDIFEQLLFNIVNDCLTREKLLNNYDKLILLIDELVNGGIILNINKDSLNNRIFEERFENDNENNNNSNALISNLFGFFGAGKK